MKNLKNLKNFKGNKDGADWTLKPVDEKNKSVSDIPKLKPEEVNIILKIRPEFKVDPKTGKSLFVKRIKLCRVSELPDYKKTNSIEGDNQREFIADAIASFKVKLSVSSPEIKTGYEITVSDILNGYIIDRVQYEKDCQNKCTHLEFWRQHIGDIILMEIEPSDIVNAKAILTVSPKTINNYLTSLRGAFDYAKQTQKGFKFNPVNDVKREKVIRKDHRFLTDEERKRLFHHLETRKTSAILKDFVIFGIYIGCRKREALALFWNNIDFEDEIITFTHTIRKSLCTGTKMKNGKLVQIYKHNVRVEGLKNGLSKRKLSFKGMPRIRKLLLERWSERSCEYIFKQDCAKAWKSLLKVAGIENFRFHDLRHTCASDLYQSGKSLDEIAKYLGHTSIQSTQIYAELDTKATEECGEALTKKYG